MLPLQIKRRRESNIDPKQALRTHVEQMPVDQQRAFVCLAFQLMTGRITVDEVENSGSYGQTLHEIRQ